ncbi:hypothetical protein SO802_022845 [Lithocarpus litseifolius]|uniref:Uncharacterized protein n=1 Tax=Lithocarpus litseifolius TaxID=425828 RepID=A0AAW2C6E6_9ROSI
MDHLDFSTIAYLDNFTCLTATRAADQETVAARPRNRRRQSSPIKEASPPELVDPRIASPSSGPLRIPCASATLRLHFCRRRFAFTSAGDASPSLPPATLRLLLAPATLRLLLAPATLRLLFAPATLRLLFAPATLRLLFSSPSLRLSKPPLVPRSAAPPVKNTTLSQTNIEICIFFLKEKSRKNSENRNKTVGKHRCGTKALAVRVDEETNNNGGQVPELAKICKDVHFNPNTNRWIHHEDEATYETILKVQEDHCQDPNAIPLTQEEISNLVFKRKSGIVKGLGMRPSSSLVTTASSSSSVEYIHRLENEIIELKEARARDEEERAREQEARAKQDEIQKNILNFLRSKGYDDALTYGGGSSSS